MYLLIICLLTGLFSSVNIPAAESASSASTGLMEIPPELLAVKPKERDISLTISVESVLQKVKAKPEIILIDVRSAEKFGRYRIPGSINLPLFAVKTRTFLKDKKVVLFNEGYSYGELEQECQRLRDSGFASVYIMDGGLSYWKEKGGTLEGDVPDQKEMNRISPAEFFNERGYNNWLIINVSETKSSEADYLMPQAVYIPYNNNAGEFVTQIKTAIGEHQGSPLPSVLIFNEAGNYQKLEPLLEKSGLNHAFYLKDGLAGYKAFLQQQAVIWRSKNKPLKPADKCKSCP